MLVRIGLELDNEGRALAWALDHPGCFAYGVEGPDAVISLAGAMVRYNQWIERHAGESWLEDDHFDLRLVETWQVFTLNDQYELEEGAYAVNAWFRDDWKPLSAAQVERGISLLGWSREDLLAVVAGLGEEHLDRQYEGERWSIRGILKHVANAEWWYLNRLGLVGDGRPDLPKDALERLSVVREKISASLPVLVGKELVLGKEGEFWSPRKLLRRVLWHEINHREHILKLIKA